MVLKLVDVRVESNTKVEIYHGSYLGHSVEAVKIYNRKTSLSPFKFTRQLYKSDLNDQPFNYPEFLKKFIKDNCIKIKGTNADSLEKEGSV
jgi:hypothetical protein